MPECYVRGSTIKYMRIPDEVIDMVKEEQMKPKGRGDPRGRGGGGRGRGGMPQRGECSVEMHFHIYLSCNSVIVLLLRGDCWRKYNKQEHSVGTDLQQGASLPQTNKHYRKYNLLV